MEQISPSASQFKSFVSIGQTISVPDQGTLFLKTGAGVPTSATPLRVPSTLSLIQLSIEVDSVDSSRSYALKVFSNNTEVASLTLPASQAGAAVVLPSPVGLSAGDRLSAKLERSSGSGRSTFANIQALLVFSG